MPLRRHLVTVSSAVAGSALFAYAVQRAGVTEILEGIRSVGSGLLVVLALAGLRFLLRAECWRLSVPPPGELSRTRAISAFLAGDAVGSVTPLGLLASEPTKVILARRHLATREAVSSLALENLIYAASVVAVVAAGVAVMLAIVPLEAAWRWSGLASLGALALAVFVSLRLLRGTWKEQRGPRPRWREQLAGVRMAVVSAAAQYGGRLWVVFALDLLFHALAVVEIFVTLRWLQGDRSPTLAQAIVFEALNRVVTVVFKFVPFRIGVDEATSGALAPMLAVDPAAGVALAVVRKIRNLFWAGVGLGVVVTHPSAESGAPES